MQEQQNIEWKESWRDEYLKWICGFANAQGGKIYIGKNILRFHTTLILQMPFLEQVMLNRGDVEQFKF